MDNEDRSLSELLRRTVPAPTARVEFDQIASRVRRRRITGWMAGSGAVGAIVLASVVAASLVGDPDRGPDASVAATGPTASSTPSGSPESGCPPTEPYQDGKVVMVDYVSFIDLGGQQFVGHLDGGPALSRADLGEQIATVTCRIADLTESGTEHVVGGYLDGNAAYLNAGTPIYALHGYATTCRVAVIENGDVTAYLAQLVGVENHADSVPHNHVPELVRRA